MLKSSIDRKHKNKYLSESKADVKGKEIGEFNKRFFSAESVYPTAIFKKCSLELTKNDDLRFTNLFPNSKLPNEMREVLEILITDQGGHLEQPRMIDEDVSNVNRAREIINTTVDSPIRIYGTDSLWECCIMKGDSNERGSFRIFGKYEDVDNRSGKFVIWFLDPYHLVFPWQRSHSKNGYGDKYEANIDNASKFPDEIRAELEGIEKLSE